MHRVKRAYVDSTGSVHLVERGGSDKTIPKEKDQVGSDSIKIADDKKTVGWMILYENCCTSYPIPLVLVIYRDGRVQLRLKPGQMIYGWRFWAGGKQAAFCSGTVHGDSGGHCELRDAKNGRKVRVINGHLDPHSPEWARGLHD